jgi:hypothetical protein
MVFGFEVEQYAHVQRSDTDITSGREGRGEGNTVKLLQAPSTFLKKLLRYTSWIDSNTSTPPLRSSI